MVYSLVSSRSKGSKLWDIDGNEYIDLVNGFGPTMFGHAPEFVLKAMQEQMNEGFAIGPQTPLAGKAADLLTADDGHRSGDVLQHRLRGGDGGDAHCAYRDGKRSEWSSLPATITDSLTKFW